MIEENDDWNEETEGNDEENRDEEAE